MFELSPNEVILAVGLALNLLLVGSMWGSNRRQMHDQGKWLERVSKGHDDHIEDHAKGAFRNGRQT